MDFLEIAKTTYANSLSYLLYDNTDASVVLLIIHDVY